MNTTHTFEWLQYPLKMYSFLTESGYRTNDKTVDISHITSLLVK